MARFIESATEKVGKAPGTLVFIGERFVDTVTVEVIEFNAESAKVYKDQNPHDLVRFKESSDISWINVVGLHDTETIKAIGDTFNLHPLLQEAVVNTGQRPKCEEFDEQMFLVLKMMIPDESDGHIKSEQVSMVVGDKYLITFQEEPQDVFKSVRDRIIRPTTKIRHRKSDYLAYALMDAIVDHYILIIEQFGERVEKLEQAIVEDAEPEQLESIYGYKRELSFLRKSIRPVRDLVVEYKNSESSLMEDQTIAYIKDLEDHIVHAAEAVETYQVMLNDQLNLYQSIVNNRLNDILRVLTIFSVVFIPLTFLAGIYGTNFKYLPELEYQYAYPIFWLALIVIAGLMLLYFRRKKWL